MSAVLSVHELNNWWHLAAVSAQLVLVMTSCHMLACSAHWTGCLEIKFHRGVTAVAAHQGGITDR